jgi:hypothetical protein
MKPTPIVTLVCATLLCVGSAVWLNADEARPKSWPKATPPPPPSPIYHEVKEPMPDAAQIEREARERNQALALQIERALLMGDEQQRETAFTFLLPELIQLAPDSLVDMVARQDPGEARDRLRTEVARQWMATDPQAATAWMKTLDETERQASARAAMLSITAHSPALANDLAEEFGVALNGLGHESPARSLPATSRN